MKNILITLLFFLTYSSILLSQDSEIWSENFANGIPSDWEINEISNFGITWTYCPDTTMFSTGDDNTCPHNFNTFFDGFQTHFKSDTLENGYATCVLEPFINNPSFNSEFELELTTSSIDCSDETNVFVTFNSHIGLNRAFGERDVELRVSTDKVTLDPFFSISPT